MQFMQMATEARDLAQQLSECRGQDIASENLLLTFHPNSTFSSDERDPTDFALRSPFPTLLLLRGVDVRRAEEIYSQQGQTTEAVAMANEARLASLGFTYLRDMLEEVMKEARKGTPEQHGPWTDHVTHGK
jgi:hypothetical protein